VGDDDDASDGCYVTFFALTSGTYMIMVIGRGYGLSNGILNGIRR
jgi:hypothetical protein